jgi:hypothetical protein
LGIAVVAPDGDEFVVVFDYERQAIDVIDLGEVSHLIVR